MNILKRSLAPITDKAWEEIELQSERVIREKVDLCFTASFAWRILSPEAFRVMIPG